jgi:hypothetical protein
MLSFKAERSNIIELFIHFDTLKKCPVIINLIISTQLISFPISRDEREHLEPESPVLTRYPPS